MFKVPAESVEEYFRFDPEREHSLRELDALIRAAAPALSRWFVPGTPPGQPGMTMTLIGYGQYEYTVKSSPIPVTWPVLGIALQKSYLSFYSNVYADRQNFIAGYAGKLGPARVSAKGVVTFATLGDIDQNALAAAIAEIAAGLESGRRAGWPRSSPSGGLQYLRHRRSRHLSRARQHAVAGAGSVGGEICQYLRMQIIEASVVGVRSAVITFLRPDTPMQIVLFPMLHLGSTGFYKAVADRLRGCQLIVAEGIQGRSATASLLTMSYRLLGRSRRLGLVVQDLHLDSLGGTVIRPDMTGKELSKRWRKGVRLLHRLLIIAAVPVFAAGMLLFGTRRVLGRYLALDDLPTREQELLAFEDIDKVIVDDRDGLVIDALSSIYQQRSAEAISVAVVYGAGHMPAIAAMLVSRLGYHARSAEWLTVFDYS